MFIDEVEITIHGGHGGAGLISFGKKIKSGPDGGNGGKGGDVYFTADNNLTLLNQFSRKTEFWAENGAVGGRNRKTGKDGAELEIKLPVGTSVIDIDNGELLFEMEKKGQKERICKGGKGGRGNFEFRSPRRTTPEYAQPGLPGEKRSVKLLLKLTADYGLIGLPNAGKSSLLNELTRAQAKTANYAFTTLHPNLGVLNEKVIADIPGLIEGASTGRGLGVSFLKHIEKVGKLLHCISVESKDPMKDYEIIRNEIGIFNMKLLQKPEIILITKSDLVEKDVIKSIETMFKKDKEVLSVSIHDWDSLEKLKSTLFK